MKLLPFTKPLGTTSAQIAYYAKQVSLGYVLESSSVIDGIGELLYKYTDSVNMVHYYYQRPIMEQYGNWLVNVFTKWDWGVSTVIMENVDVGIIISTKLPTTIEVNVISVLISVPLGVALGVWAALKKNKPTDTVISTLVMVLISVPSFVIISFLIMTLGYSAKVLPTSWPSTRAPMNTRVLGFIIPVVSLSCGSICGYCRFTRAELCEVLDSDYLLLARTKGLTKRQAVMRHALRNAMVPILPSILAEIVGVLSGSMILETLYGIPGIGSLFYTAVTAKDYNVLMVDMALFTLIGLLAGIILDLSYGFLDPRIRMGEKK
jgi:oligopeptide transport system permease protein